MPRPNLACAPTLIRHQLALISRAHPPSYTAQPIDPDEDSAIATMSKFEPADLRIGVRQKSPEDILARPERKEPKFELAD
eukprot:6036985-Prymnesium_polylepis.1